MTVAITAKSPFDRARILQAAESLGLIGSGAESLARLLSKLCDSRASGEEIAVLIENHPVLCARVLRVANSAYYGQQRSITTVKQAVLLLGVNAIRGVAAAACVDRATPRRMHGNPVDMPALLRHSLATAVAADSLARLTHQHLASEAFIAGVLHNLGVAVQINIDRAGVNSMIDARQRDPTRGMRALEADHVCVRHEDCVAAILDAWELPEALVVATGCHHDPGAAPQAHRDLATLVSLGATLALASGHTFSLEIEAEAAVLERELQAARRLGIGAQELDRITTGLPETVQNLQRALFGTGI
jgi:HD-like signal output (HDOD) protein